MHYYQKKKKKSRYQNYIFFNDNFLGNFGQYSYKTWIAILKLIVDRNWDLKVIHLISGSTSFYLKII